MAHPIILASGSEIRRKLLENAGVPHRIVPARIDEEAVKAALVADHVAPRDIADALADAKARRVSGKYPGDLVIGADQVLELNGVLLSKPADRGEAAHQLGCLSGRRHELHSAVVVYEDGRPVWRHVERAQLTMRPITEGFIARYLDRNWDSVRNSVGAYRIEEEGVRLFSTVSGSYFTILGLPLLQLLAYLGERGVIET